MTALLCDHNLGDGLPTGAELIPRWRAQYPGIARAMLFTGSVREEIDLPPEVDQLLSKPVSVAELLEVFGVRV